ISSPKLGGSLIHRIGQSGDYNSASPDRARTRNFFVSGLIFCAKILLRLIVYLACFFMRISVARLLFGPSRALPHALTQCAWIGVFNAPHEGHVVFKRGWRCVGM